MNILGLSAYYHDSAAVLVIDGDIVAAAQEERFTRIKHDPAFPEQAINYCLTKAGLALDKVDYVVFYDKPMLKFERLLETYLHEAPKGLRAFMMSMPVWVKEKLFLKSELRKELARASGLETTALPKLLFTQHHQSHAASAFYPSPYEKSAVICMDGVGEWATTSVWLGDGRSLQPVWEMKFPHSLGMLYSAFTYFTGFKVNSGEYKLMGLAPYGTPKYKDAIMEHLLDVKEDGTFRMNMDYFNYMSGLTMTNRKFDKIFDGPRRKPESTITQREMDIASSIQHVTEEIVLKLCNAVADELQVDNLCLAGGVALNCVANGRLLREGKIKNIWIQPAAGDAGGALGAALAVWHDYLERPRSVSSTDSMKGSYLGPEFSDAEIEKFLVDSGAVYNHYTTDSMVREVAGQLSQDKVIGWFQGKMEFGPRALGGRSIIGDPRSERMQSVMNLKIKYRESFRPFAPSVLAEKVSDYFELDEASPYMLIVAPVKENLRIPMSDEEQSLFGINKLRVSRSTLPAITHVDYSARVQTVHEHTNPTYFKLLKAFDEISGCAAVVNTSFNVRGEPIVCTPEDAYRCFMRTEMDYLVLGNFILDKATQPVQQTDDSWKTEFALD